MTASETFLNTEDFGRAIGVKPQSIRVRLCRTGSYFGIRPSKLPNGRLAWPSDAPTRLVAAGAGGDASEAA